MNRRDIVIGLLILAALAFAIYFIRKPSQPGIGPSPTPSVEENLEEKFKMQIPESGQKTELRDVSGGNASAIAVRDFQNNKFTLSILADLPEPPSGEVYEAWLEEGEQTPVLLGRLQVAKGGYLIDYQSSKDYTNFNKLVLTMEKVLDQKIETRILEGSF